MHPGVFPAPDALYVSRFVAADRPQTNSEVVRWDDLRAALTQHTIVEAKESVGLFNFCRFSTPYRKNTNVIDVSALLLDVDDKPTDVVRELAAKLAPFEHFGYTTHRHGASPDSWRLRVVVRLSRPVLAAEWRTFAYGVQAWLGGENLDGVVVAASQAYYLPSCPQSRAHLRATFQNPGRSLPVQEVLAHTPEQTPASGPLADTWRPETTVTRRHLAALPGEVAKRLLEGKELAPHGERHKSRRGVVFQLLCEFGPCEPDADLLQLLVASAEAPRETWLREFYSSSARGKAENAYAAKQEEIRLAREKDATEAELWRLALEQQSREQAAQLAVSQALATASAGAVVARDEIKLLAARAAKTDVGVGAILKAVARGALIDAELVEALPKVGQWVGRNKPGARVDSILRHFEPSMPAPEHLQLVRKGLEEGQLAARSKENWRRALSTTDDKIAPCEKNVRILLEQHPEVNGQLVYDERCHTTRVGAVPWKRGEGIQWSAADAGGAMVWASDIIGSAVSSRQIEEAVEGLKEGLPKYDGVVSYLASLPQWDGVPRLSTWLHVYAGASPDEYTAKVARASLIGALARALRPGCKVDQVPVLEGEQGGKKTALLRALCPDDSFFITADGSLSLENIRLTHKLQGPWIVELGELAGLRKSDQEAAKAFLSEQTDSFRAPYGRHVLKRPRRFVFFGTSTRTDYLQDETGNRRFLPIAGPLICRPDLLLRDRDQVWAEALAAFHAGEKWWVEQTEDVKAVQSSRVEIDSLSGQVMECVEHFGEASYEQIFAYLGVSADRQHAHRLRRILLLENCVQGPKQRKEIILPAVAGQFVGRSKYVNDRFWSKQ